MKNWLNWSKDELAEQLWATEPRIRQIFRNSRHMEEARHLLFDYLNRLERDLFNMRSDTYFVDLNIVEKRNAKECIRVLSNTLRSENEYVTHFSPMQILYDIAQGKKEALDQVSEAFLCEYLALFLGITGKMARLGQMGADDCLISSVQTAGKRVVYRVDAISAMGADAARIRAAHRAMLRTAAEEALAHVTEVFRLHRECYDEETREFVLDIGANDPFGFRRLRYVRSVEESKALNMARNPLVIISASGMAEAGRVQHHLLHAVEDARNAVVIAGWQAPNTLGRRIAERSPEVRIFGETFPLRAEVFELYAYSAHADRDDLLRWAAGRDRPTQLGVMQLAAAVELRQGRCEAAERLFHEMLASSREFGSSAHQLRARSGLASVAECRGALEDAERAHGEVVRLARKLDLRHSEIHALYRMAAMARARGRHDRAGQHLSRAFALVRDTDLDPCLPRAGQVAHADRGLVRIGQALRKRDALAVLETVGEQARYQVLAGLRRVPSHPRRQAGKLRNFSIRTIRAFTTCRPATPHP